MKRLFILVAVLLIVGCLCFALYFTYAPDKNEDPPDYSDIVRLPEPTSIPVREPQQTEPAPASSPEPAPYLSPIDFEALWDRNPDIIAWMDIPNTDISYPVVQRKGDDAFYLKHNSDGDYSTVGALFSESAYNTDDFSDLITALYGHRTRGVTMLGRLQSLYSEENAMQDYGLVRVFLPDKELDYEVFAAMPYSSVHIPDTYGVNDLRGKRLFQYHISDTHSLDGRVVNERFPQTEDPVLILSTCLTGNDDRRFLVFARQISAS